MKQNPWQPKIAQQRDGFWRRTAFTIGAVIFLLIIVGFFSHVLALALGSYIVLGAIIVAILGLVRQTFRGKRIFQPQQPDQIYYQPFPPQQPNYQPYDQGYQQPHHSPRNTLQDQLRQVPASNEEDDRPQANYPEPMPPAEQ